MKKLLFPLTEISAGSIVFVSQNHIAGELIKLYEKLEDPTYFLKTKFIPNHAMTYFGGSKNLCFSAEPRGFMQIPIQSKFTQDSVVVVAQYLPLTIDNFDGMKDYCYGAKGKLYNFGAIGNFVLKGLGFMPFIRRFFHNKVSNWSWALFCSEAVVEMYHCADIQISGLPAKKTTPCEILRYISGCNYLGENSKTINSWRFRVLYKGKEAL